MKNSETAKFQWTEEDSNKQEKITTNTRKHRESSRHYFSYQNIGETCRAENDVAELGCYPPQPELVHRHQLPPAPQQSLAAASQQQQPLQITLCQQPPLLYYILYFSSIYLHFNFVFDLFHMVVNCTVQDLYRKMWPIVRNGLIPLSPTSPPLLPVTGIILGVPLKDLLGAPSPQVLPLPPHLLELDPDLVEGLRDDGNEDVLHHPGQEEDHRHEVEWGLPGVQGVRGPVHDVHPALLYIQYGCITLHSSLHT